ncbi:hypothetical protein SAMN06265222_102371 [Neorhodopirellula lusitana]|uniref:Pectate lyase superfamily protein domain-containing protein n=1 Tax=Neorhodopirellula lusitana TaxID=445327 RepID=A0ABY1PYI7_9BACT|nr:hypothetical protein [Neorhodopirellula lusitana]SMP47984.1 hypothetical protein SAMN06265222_102371 [Neorhodopirellula lusitana]
MNRFLIAVALFINTVVCFSVRAESHLTVGFVNAAEYGFSPSASGIDNTQALQQAVDQGGTIMVSQPGTYAIAGTVYIGSHTSLVFGNNVFLKKVNEQGAFTHVLLNKGALTKTTDENITVKGLHIIVNGVDKGFTEVYGLRGHLAFFYVKDLRIERFRCMDLARTQFCIHVCNFEDLIINDVIIKGQKDGIHLGRGKRFTISNGVFQTFDDAIALNAHDYSSSNPELGWIEDGVVEKCYDLDQPNTTGYFCRILAGAWIDWKQAMEVQQSDTVVSNGRLYRVQAQADGTVYTSQTQPTHDSGSQVLDGINWGVVQNDVTYTAGVRNVVFRDIFLQKPRTGFSVHFDNDKYSRSYYPGAPVVQQEQLLFDNIRVLHKGNTDLFSIGTPVDVLTITNCSLRNNKIRFRGNKAMADYGKTQINITGCVFQHDGEMALVTNTVDRKEIYLQTASNTVLNADFKATIEPGSGNIVVRSDLPGLE